MRLILICILVLFFTSSCSETSKKKAKVTVVLFDNHNLDRIVKIDTVMNAKPFDLPVSKPDIFFCHQYFSLPYYVPTGSILRDSIKDKECDWKIYPNTVKCYEYDKMNRVTRMSVEGSGTSSDFRYIYNSLNQVIRIMEGGYEKYLLSYNADGTLGELREVSLDMEQKLVFIYE
jgi:hypothetical protein